MCTPYPNLLGVWKSYNTKIAVTSVACAPNSQQFVDSVICGDFELYFKNQIKNLFWITKTFRHVYPNPDTDPIVTQSVGSLTNKKAGNFIDSAVSQVGYSEFILISENKMQLTFTGVNNVDGSIAAYTALFRRIDDESC